MKQPLDQRMTDERDLECSYQGEPDWVSLVALVAFALPFIWLVWVTVGIVMMHL